MSVIWNSLRRIRCYFKHCAGMFVRYYSLCFAFVIFLASSMTFWRHLRGLRYFCYVRLFHREEGKISLVAGCSCCEVFAVLLWEFTIVFNVSIVVNVSIVEQHYACGVMEWFPKYYCKILFSQWIRYKIVSTVLTVVKLLWLELSDKWIS